MYKIIGIEKITKKNGDIFYGVSVTSPILSNGTGDKAEWLFVVPNAMDLSLKVGDKVHVLRNSQGYVQGFLKAQ